MSAEYQDLFEIYEPGGDLFAPITLPNGVQVSSWLGDDGAMVFEIATTANFHQKVRVYVNEGDVFDGDPDLPVYSTKTTTEEES